MHSLTDEQTLIVNHNHGAALVFAVAGAGKTTSLIHRIRRLVDDGIFRPRRILATSFSRESVKDILKKLESFPQCAEVRVSTLHSVGYGILRKAMEMKVIPELQLPETETDSFQLQIAREAVKEARTLQVAVPEHFEVHDFLDFVGKCKANLQYADLEHARLPLEARTVATQAEAPAGVPYYLELYQLFEKLRSSRNVITFDDMIVLAWEHSLRHPKLLAHVEGMYDAILVDEFQDLNLAQSELLHLMVRKHHNVMALGDDDQTIYGWRGSSPFFIRNFQARYDAVKYFITKNFRSFASHLALANYVIEQNEDREKKTLNLTRGFEGNTAVVGVGSFADSARRIADEVEENVKKGLKLRDHAVLVRIYALTPFIETEFIERRIPYRILGSTPFYKRDEIRALLRYLRVALLEHALQKGERLSHKQKEELSVSFNTCVMVPRKFIPARYVSTLMQQVLEDGKGLMNRLLVHSGEAQHERFSKGLLQLHGVLGMLLDCIEGDVPAEQALAELMQDIHYQHHLETSTANPDLAEARFLGAQSLARYAQGKGTLAEFIAHIDHISFQEANDEQEKSRDRVLMTTPYRAKGLQWPVVFVPGANDGTMPMRGSFGDKMKMEEERRVFYVAITRAQQDLHVHYLEGATAPGVSRFLTGYPPGQLPPPGHRTFAEVLQETEQVRQALTRTGALKPAEAFALLEHVKRNHFGRFITDHAQDQPALGLNHMLKLSQEVLGAAEALRDFGFFASGHLEPWEYFGQEPSEVSFSAQVLQDFRETVQPGPTLDRAKPTFSQHLPAALTPRVGHQVEHPKLGGGTIQEVGGQGDRLEVLVQFDRSEVGMKRMRWMFANLKVLA
ncbi:ATP-dependent helicase [Deinococcus roseus]|uniref:ATP-dependent helicase n=1 Tax=Deinococcus roseus TaxID=392414 RepID=UPI001667F70A|nr:ATP-dependent helicase [Deinococcus roseus]